MRSLYPFPFLGADVTVEQTAYRSAINKSISELMMHYLGQQIELTQENSGWVGIWWHSAGYRVEMGFFPTAMAAWDAIVELIRRDFAVRALLEVVEEWLDLKWINDREYSTSAEALIESVIAVES